MKSKDDMRLNYCPVCGSRIEGPALECSACGADLRTFTETKYGGDFKEQLEKMMKDLVEQNEETLRKMAEKMARGEITPGGMFFSVEIRDGKPIIKSGTLEEFQKIMKNYPLPAFLKDIMRRNNYSLEFREAEAEVRESPRGKEISVSMPGVERIEDVEINKKGVSLEIAGKSARTVYFSQISLEREDTVIGADLRGGVLKVTVKRP
jgi:HSP20 family molecular chaperone IbpA